MCSTPAFYAWRRLPLICLKLLVDCVYETGLLLLFANVALLARSTDLYLQYMHVRIQALFRRADKGVLTV